MGTIVTLILWTALACCSLVTAAGLDAMRRVQGWGDAGSWDGPLFYASLSLALATALGLLPPAIGAVLAAVPLAVVAVTLRKVWQAAASKYGPASATGRVLRALLRNARHTLLHAARELRRLTARPGAAAPAAPDPDPVIARPRREPSTARPDLALGPAPVPEQVARELESAGVAVPACWAAVAEWEASFEPEDGEDWRRHVAERAAGILTVAEAGGWQAEDLAAGVKLDAAVVAAETDFADDLADTASAAARSIQVYDSVYGGVHDHVDSGGTLPEDARGWFGAGGPEGAAA